jgi:integrase
MILKHLIQKSMAKLRSSELTHKLHKASKTKDRRMKVFSVTVMMRKRSIDPKTGIGSVCLKLAYGSEQRPSTTGIRCKSENLDRDNRRINGNKVDDLLLQNYLTKAQNFATELKITGRAIDLDLIKKATFDLFIEGIPNIEECINMLYKQDEERFAVGEIVKGSLRKNQVWKEQLIEFCKLQYGSFGQLSHIKPADMKTWELWLKSKKYNAQNATQNKALFFKRVMTFAVANEWIQCNPFLIFRRKIENKKRLGLTQDEIMKLQNLTCIDPNYDRVRECYLFMLYTGLGHKDCWNLKPEHLDVSEKNGLYIAKPRSKTSKEQIIKLNTFCIDLLEKYKDDEYCKRNGLMLPFPSLEHINRMLKLIGQMAYVKKVLSTNLGRHTISSLLANGGASEKTQIGVLGNTIAVNRKHYQTIERETILRETSEVFQQLKIG